MTDHKRIAAVAALVCGAALTCTGLAHAYDGQTHRTCTTDSRGNTSCVQTQKSQSRTTYRTSDGTVHINQSQSCSSRSESRVVKPQSGQGQKGTTTIGPRTDCSNHLPSLKGFVVPHIVVR